MGRLAILVIAALTLGFPIVTGWAQSTTDQPPLASPLTFNEAIAIALAKQPGTVAEIALERWSGRVVVDIEVVNDAGDEIEFLLDPVSGEILATWTDDDPGDDPGQTTETDPDG